ncbi:MAG: ABC transporter ATP-binding protein [Termitinemataceae bacterium]|nr:MAG: ABC transporter ATP-binding protein [Termitinemataceae bacterium]
MKSICFEIKNLYKIFNDKSVALNNINLDIYEGETLIIAGSNGSGKTLLMHIITGLTDPTSGKVIFRGIDIEKAGNELRKKTGIVFQDADAQIIGETVLDDIYFGPKNLKYNKHEIETAAAHALKAMHLEDKKDFPPCTLSGGEKRRLAIAGILAMGCEIIIMDEPFANLDYNGVKQTLHAVKELKESNKTVIILTHELEKVLAFAERLVIINSGVIADDGKPQEVLDRLKPEYAVRDPRQVYKTADDCSWI